MITVNVLVYIRWFVLMVLITMLVKLGEHSIPSPTLGIGRSKRGDVLPICLHDIDKITLTDWLKNCTF